MMKYTVFALTILEFCVLCDGCVPVQTITTISGTAGSTTLTSPVTNGRKKREIETMELDEDFAIISALTFFPFGNDDENTQNADKVEQQIREFISAEQIKESKFGKYQRKMLKDETEYLRVAYVLSKGGKFCDELVKLAIKAIHFAENVAQGEITCDGERVDVNKIE